MGLEIERKFLLKNSNWRKVAGKGKSIKQGYLNLDKERTVRVRTMDKLAFLTIKGKTTGATRLEFEYEIPLEEAQEMLKLSKKTIIEKTRYEVLHHNKTWEIDVFEGDNTGLLIAEIELNSEEEDILTPEWAGKEVTTESKYYNSNLVNRPFKDW